MTLSLSSINNFLFFLILLFSGSDKFGFDFLGMNIRFIYFIILLFILVNTKYIKFYNINYILLIIITHLTSIYYARYPEYSIYYILWLIVNSLFLLCVVHHVLNTNENNIEKSIIVSFRIMSILIILTFLFGVIDINLFGWALPVEDIGAVRVHLWHHEPSNLAIHMSAYMFFAFIYYKRYKKIVDLILSLMSMVLMSSTTAYIAIIIFLMLALYIQRINIKIFIYTTLIFLISYALSPNLINLYLGRLFTLDINTSSGGRYNAIISKIPSFSEMQYFGSGAFALHNIGGTPPNITIELLLTVGLFGLIAFYIFIMKILFTNIFSNNTVNKIVGYSGLCMLILLQSSQNYLRVYFWLYLGIIMAYNIKSRHIFRK